jgi:hypothetical protein
LIKYKSKVQYNECNEKASAQAIEIQGTDFPSDRWQYRYITKKQKFTNHKKHRNFYFLNLLSEADDIDGESGVRGEKAAFADLGS